MPCRRWSTRLVLGLLLGVVFLSAAPGRALAHGRGSDATNFRGTITSAPRGEGLHWRILGGDERLELHNRGPHQVIVLGLQDEPYLRIGPGGAFENRRSPTVPLQRERYATGMAGMAGIDHGPAGGYDADAPPEWVRVSARPRWAWHDHRIHWMSPRVPDVRGETVIIPRWEVPVLIDGRPATVVGELRWIPAPPWWPWLGQGLLLSLPALVGLRHLRVGDAPGGPLPVGAAEPTAGDTEPPGPALPAATGPAGVALALVALLSAVHLVDDLALPGPVGEKAFAASQTLLYLGLAVGGAWRARRGDYAGVTALAIGSGALFLGQGLLYLPVLGASQVGHAAPAWLLRLAVGAAVVQVLPIGLVAWRVGRRVQPPQATAEPSAS